MSSMIHPEWWRGSLVDAQQEVSAGRSTFGEAVDFLLADLLTSREFLSFLLAETTTRMAAGYALEEAVYAVTEEAAVRLQAPVLSAVSPVRGRRSRTGMRR
jgi:hypothetical protein